MVTFVLWHYSRSAMFTLLHTLPRRKKKHRSVRCRVLVALLKHKQAMGCGMSRGFAVRVQSPRRHSAGSRTLCKDAAVISAPTSHLAQPWEGSREQEKEQQEEEEEETERRQPPGAELAGNAGLSEQEYASVDDSRHEPTSVENCKLTFADGSCSYQRTRPATPTSIQTPPSLPAPPTYFRTPPTSLPAKVGGPGQSKPTPPTTPCLTRVAVCIAPFMLA